MAGVVKAVLFDMDGVLLDTESVCRTCWRSAADEFGVDDIDSVFMRCVGRSSADSQKILAERLGGTKNADLFRERTNVLFARVEAEQGLALMDGAAACLERLRSRGFRLALASSTVSEAVNRQLKAAGIKQFFETVTTGDMVASSKPDPEIYLKAAASLSLPPSECVAVEDSPNGVRSAVAAGMRCIMVPDMIESDDEMRALAWSILPSLNELSL